MTRIVKAARWPAMALYAVATFLYAFSGLLVPWPGLSVLWIGWGVITYGVVVAWRRRRDGLVVASPLVAYGFWALVVLIGEAIFGWTA